jgi:hypothetical protein
MSGGSCTGLFVGGPNTINTADGALLDHIESLGYPMTYITCSATNSTSWVGYGFVYISDSCSASNIGTKFLNAQVGVILQVPAAYDQMNFSNVNGVTNGGQTQIRITPAGALHPVAAGNPSGIVTTSSNPSSYNSSATNATFGSGVTLIAEVASNQNRRTIFAYETGSLMVGNFVAPARRLASHYRGSAGIVASLTTEGLNIFAATINWIANGATKDCNGVCNGPAIFDCAGVCYDPDSVMRPANCIGCDGICRPCCDGTVYPDCSGTCKVCLTSSVKSQMKPVVETKKVICVNQFPLKLRALNSKRKK